MSDAKVELGRRLFYDERLSVNGTMSCSTCHRQELAFSDGKANPVGATHQVVPRNSMSLANVAYFYPYTWANPLLLTLEEQALVPMFADFPIELGLGPVVSAVLADFQADELYADLFPRAFPGVPEPFEASRVVQAVAAFERTIISGDSAYDRYAYGGDEDALSAEAKLGLSLFNSERLECYHCHTGLNFTSAFRSQGTPMPGKDFQNNGLYNLDAEGSYPAESPGLSAITGKASDRGKFRVPTLRNVAVTAPYMHDGSLSTLDEVIAVYANGGRAIEAGSNAGDGSKNPNKNPLVRGFTLTSEEKRALFAFLESLTDEAFLEDPRFSNPWGSAAR